MAESDAQLVERAVRGDRQALADLVERHAEDARRSLGIAIPTRFQSTLSLDDVMQQAYTDAVLGIGRFEHRGDGSFSAWLAALARNNLLNAIRMLDTDKRGGGRGHAVVDDSSFVQLFEAVGGVSATPSRDVATREAKSAVEASIDRLPELYRNVVRMYDLEERPVGAIAEELGRSAGAIYMLRARAHRMLAELLGTASRYLSMQ